jgi:glycosyltransferase involved in cell wall biosynthesis
VITVVIPTIAPRVQLLDRALRSVEAQKLRPDTVIVIADGERAGAAAVRNRALAEVRTEHVAFLDDDDVWYPDHLLKLARYARLSGVDVAYPAYDCEGGDDPVNCFGIPFDASLLRRRNFIPVTVLAKTELVRDAGGFQERPDENGDPCEDWGLWLAMLDGGAKFGHLPVKTWRWTLGDTTTKGRPDRW